MRKEVFYARLCIRRPVFPRSRCPESRPEEEKASVVSVAAKDKNCPYKNHCSSICAECDFHVVFESFRNKIDRLKKKIKRLENCFAEPQTTQTIGLKQCPNCRADIDEDYKYCPWCGEYAPSLEE